MEVVFENISKKYKNKYALKDINITLKNGVYGLLGENGAGKTTLISILVGILKNDTGNIYIDGKNTKDMGRDFLSHIGYLPQYTEFYRDFSITDFLLYICAIKGIDKKDGINQIDELLKKVNLSNIKYKKIGTLSGGMRQRVGIVSAVLGNPSILILDEPTAGLDPNERIRFRNLIAQFSENRIVILATHIVSDIEFIANEVILLKNGALMKQDTIKNLAKEIYGNVWEVCGGNNELIKLQRYKISNIQRENENIVMRIISSEKPTDTARLVTAGLEDVFLFYQDEEVIND